MRTPNTVRTMMSALHKMEDSDDDFESEVFDAIHTLSATQKALLKLIEITDSLGESGAVPSSTAAAIRNHLNNSGESLLAVYDIFEDILAIMDGAK